MIYSWYNVNNSEFKNIQRPFLIKFHNGPKYGFFRQNKSLPRSSLFQIIKQYPFVDRRRSIMWWMSYRCMNGFIRYIFKIYPNRQMNDDGETSSYIICWQHLNSKTVSNQTHKNNSKSYNYFVITRCEWGKKTLPSHNQSHNLACYLQFFLFIYSFESYLPSFYLCIHLA